MQIMTFFSCSCEIFFIISFNYLNVLLRFVDWMKLNMFVHVDFMLIHVDFDTLHVGKADIGVLIG